MNNIFTDEPFYRLKNSKDGAIEIPGKISLDKIKADIDNVFKTKTPEQLVRCFERARIKSTPASVDALFNGLCVKAGLELKPSVEVASFEEAIDLAVIILFMEMDHSKVENASKIIDHFKKSGYYKILKPYIKPSDRVEWDRCGLLDYRSKILGSDGKYENAPIWQDYLEVFGTSGVDYMMDYTKNREQFNPYMEAFAPLYGSIRGLSKDLLSFKTYITWTLERNDFNPEPVVIRMVNMCWFSCWDKVALISTATDWPSWSCRALPLSIYGMINLPHINIFVLKKAKLT